MLKIVKTENGLVRGLPGNNTRITAFKGIPFAAPPVGENRWKAPQPCKDWEGIYDAYKFAPSLYRTSPESELTSTAGNGTSIRILRSMRTAST